MADLRFCMSALPPKADMCSTNTLSRTLIDRSLGDPALASDTVQARCAALTPTREHCDHDTKEIICLCAKIVKFLILLLVSVALVTDVAFITWATKLNFFIVVPVVLSAAYLAYMAAHMTIWSDQK